MIEKSETTVRDLLPHRVFEALQDRYSAGVANAEAHFNQHSADDDSIAGAIGPHFAPVHGSLPSEVPRGSTTLSRSQAGAQTGPPNAASGTRSMSYDMRVLAPDLDLSIALAVLL